MNKQELIRELRVDLAGIQRKLDQAINEGNNQASMDYSYDLGLVQGQLLCLDSKAYKLATVNA
jgi:hypothetical protein